MLVQLKRQQAGQLVQRRGRPDILQRRAFLAWQQGFGAKGDQPALPLRRRIERLDLSGAQDRP
ncbi:hypothetical protein DWF00_04330 [Bosea caraganae]|nr:hypothetical protein DWF00_04330 [Bosea caraganae]